MGLNNLAIAQSETDEAIRHTTEAITKTHSYRIYSKRIYTKIEKTLDVDATTLRVITPTIIMGIQGKISTKQIGGMKQKFVYGTIRPDLSYSIKDKNIKVMLSLEVPLD